MPKNLLIIEDEPTIYEPMSQKAKIVGFNRVETARNRQRAIDIWDASPHDFDVVVLDINLDDAGGGHNRDGWAVLKHFRKVRQDFMVLIFTGALTAEDAQMLTAVMAQPIMLFRKDRNRDEFYQTLEEIGRAGVFEAKQAFFTPEEQEHLGVLATSNIPVLIIGPPGSGKSVMARELALRSGCKDERIIPINCAGLSADLAESILFGYLRGAYTGAERHTFGHMMQASGYSKDVFESPSLSKAGARSPKGYVAYQSKQKVWGAVILDEIGALDYRVQGKLLSVLEGEPIFPLGWTGPGFLPNFRVIAATNELAALRDRERFRPDLLRRLSTWVLQCRPLSSEPNDKVEKVIRGVRLERRDGGQLVGSQTPLIDTDAVHWLVAQKGKLAGGLRELNWIVQRAWLISRRRQASKVTMDDMKNAWKFSAEIHSVLALQSDHITGSKDGQMIEKAERMRQRLEEVLGVQSGSLDRLTFINKVGDHLDPKALRESVDTVVKRDWNTLSLAIGFPSKDIRGWYRTLFSRATRAN